MKKKKEISEKSLLKEKDSLMLKVKQKIKSLNHTSEHDLSINMIQNETSSITI